MCKLVVLVAHADRLIDGDVVHIIHIFAKIQFSFSWLDYLKVLQNLNHHLRIHYCIRFSISHFASNEKVCLLKLVYQRVER